LAERLEHAGRWVALEIYSPQRLPLRRIEAEGSSAGDCVLQLAEHGLDPTRFEFHMLKPPY